MTIHRRACPGKTLKITFNSDGIPTTLDSNLAYRLVVKRFLNRFGTESRISFTPSLSHCTVQFHCYEHANNAFRCISYRHDLYAELIKFLRTQVSTQELLTSKKAVHALFTSNVVKVEWVTN